MSAEHCICCGVIIPEGRQVCIRCESGERSIVDKKAQIISALSCRAYSFLTNRTVCDHCHYRSDTGCDFRRICDDVLELLKEQDKMIIGPRNS